jgi:(4S)-4-hydroxy-5-phosphonooxypentane-2,3-dione isomerase
MIVTCIYVTVKPDAIQEFTKATVENHRESVREPGNLRFDIIQLSDDPTRFMIYEAYVSESDVSVHKTTAHYLKWRDTVAEMMAEPRKGVRYNIVEPSERSKW